MRNSAIHPIDPLEEIKALRERLEQAEEVLQAIHLGEVDGVVVESDQGTQVFTLQTPDQPYRILLECMSEGAACVSEEGIVLFCNQSLASLAGRSSEEIMGSSIGALIRPSDQHRFRGLLKRSFDGECQAEIELQHVNGTAVPVKVSLKEIPGAQVRSLCLVATDLS